MMMLRAEFMARLEQLLQTARVRDYCPNGLQVEGTDQIQRVVAGVTASQALLDAAVAAKADAIVVHHGYFWKNETPVITGIKKRRLQTLLQHDINLFGFHLPLDIHPELGNNAQLGQLLGMEKIEAVASVEPVGVVMHGYLPTPMALADIGQLVNIKLQRPPLVHAGHSGMVQHVAWCTGGGQGYIDVAEDQGADLFISGEVSEQTIHIANERQIHYIAAGHHATERYGIRALAMEMATWPGLTVEFMDLPNPA